MGVPFGDPTEHGQRSMIEIRQPRRPPGVAPLVLDLEARDVAEPSSHGLFHRATTVHVPSVALLGPWPVISTSS